MCSPYWSQWGKDDLDSWQGKDWEECKDAVDLHQEEVVLLQQCSCCNCMYCLGMSWKDFL